MNYGTLPPEVNSGRMYSGAGPGPLLAAAAAWQGLASELHSAAAGYAVVLADVAAGWHGPSAAAMTAAATPYVEWMSRTARQAEQAGAQAAAAAAAYEAAFAAHVPPPVIAANRSLLVTLTATNLLGQNTPAIAAGEAYYAEMWAQDAGAMYGYAGSASSATRLSAFGPPPETTGRFAPAQAAAKAAPGDKAGSAIGGGLAKLLAAVPNALHNAAAPTGQLPMIASAGSDVGPIADILANLGGAYSPLGPIANVGTGWLSAMQILAYAQNVPGVLSMLSGTPPITGALGPLSGGFISWQAPVGAGSLGGVSTVAALSGQASAIGSLSVPASWSAAAPMATTLATSSSLPVGSIAAPVLAVDGSTGMFSETALSSLAGRAVGGGAMRTVAGTSARVLDRAPDTEALTTATILVIPVGQE